MSGEKTKAAMSWELHLVKVAAKDLIDRIEGVAESDPATAEITPEIRASAARLRALVDGGAKEGAA